MPAYGYDEDGQREHDCCDVCGSGSCPGSGSGGDDACTYRAPCPSVYPPSADAPHEGPGWSGPLRCTMSKGHGGPDPVHWNTGIHWREPAPPLSPEERAVVEMFEAAPDPYVDDVLCTYVLDHGGGCCWCADGTPSSHAVTLLYPDDIRVEHRCCPSHALRAERLDLPEQHVDALSTVSVLPVDGA